MPTPAPSRLRVFEPALESPEFHRLFRAVKNLGNERLTTTYQTTFWFDFSAPQCLPEAVALQLRAYLPKGKRVVGAEWWLSRMKTTDVQVDFHQDRDEKLFLKEGKIVSPRWSSVFFLNRCRGGSLVVTPSLPNEENPSLCPDGDDFDVISPRPNRFVVFDGTLTHGVLDARNQVPDKKLARQVPLRLAVIFNWWHKRPTGVPTWAQATAYRSLSLKGVSR